MYATYACARCGFVNPTHARACAECGAPNPAPSPFLPPPPNAVGTPGNRGGDSGTVVKWVVGIVVGGFVMVFVIGILAAIAIPKFAGVSRNAKQAEVLPVLRHMHALQETYHQRNGTYQADLNAPGDANFFSGGPGYGMKYYTISVIEATETDLCLAAIPNDAGAASNLESFSMDENGIQYDGATCSSVSYDEVDYMDVDTMGVVPTDTMGLDVDATGEGADFEGTGYPPPSAKPSADGKPAKP